MTNFKMHDNEFRDRSNHKIGIIYGTEIRDALNMKIGSMHGEEIRDAHNRKIGTLNDAQKQISDAVDGVSLGALWVFFVR